MALFPRELMYPHHMTSQRCRCDRHKWSQPLSKHTGHSVNTDITSMTSSLLSVFIFITVVSIIIFTRPFTSVFLLSFTASFSDWSDCDVSTNIVTGRRRWDQNTGEENGGGLLNSQMDQQENHKYITTKMQQQKPEAEKKNSPAARVRHQSAARTETALINLIFRNILMQKHKSDICLKLSRHTLIQPKESSQHMYSQPMASSLRGTMLASPPADTLRVGAASAPIYASVLSADMLTPVPPGVGTQGLLTHMW